MKKLKNIVIFMLSWIVLTYLIMLVISALYPAGPDGEITLGAASTIIMVVVPIAAGIFLVKFANNRYYFAKKVTPRMVRDAIRLLPTFDYFSISLLQKKLGIKSFRVASDLANEMEKAGLVKRLPDFMWEIVGKRQNFAQTSSSCTMDVIDSMEGHDFEHWCAEVLRGNGFSDVEVTPGSGDQGVDILAEKDGIKYAVQCKCYSSDLGNKPVQEVNAGKMIYRCQIGAVMTNRYFTEGAKQAAEATGVLLWNRDDVEKMAQKAGLLTSTL